MGSCINTKPKNKIYACFVEKTLFSFVQREQFTEKREFGVSFAETMSERSGTEHRGKQSELSFGSWTDLPYM